MPQTQPNVKGMVNDPDFLSLAPADQRNALSRLTKDTSFSALSDADTLRFVSGLRSTVSAKPDAISQQMAAAQAGAGVKPPGLTLPQPQFIGSQAPASEQALAGLAGAKRGAEEAVGVPPDSKTPVRDVLSSLNQQVNQAATTPWAQGGPLYGTMAMMGRGVKGLAQGAVEGGKTAVQGAQANNVEQFYEGAGRGIASAAMLKGTAGKATTEAVQGYQGVPKAGPATAGMKYGGVPATVEKLANRIPVASQPLKKVYAQVASNFSDAVADSVSKTAGITGDASDLVGTMAKGSEAIKAQAKAAYAPVDEFTVKNNRQVLDAAVSALNADPETMRMMPNDFYDRPIAGLKQVIQGLDKKIERGGPQAFGYIQTSQKFQQALDQTLNSLPPEMKAAQMRGDALWKQQSAMSDIAGTFDKNVSGVPPGKQPAGLAQQAQGVNAGSLLESLKSEPRLRQAFGDDVANAILDHTQRLARAQGMQGGNWQGIAGGMYGTSLLARAFSGYGSASIPGELGGLWVLSKVLANPDAHPFYINMLKATSGTEQDFWAKQAVNATLSLKGKQQK
jgi:hypothetical protein